MKTKQLSQPLMRRLAGSGHENRFAVDGRSRDLLIQIKDLLNVFAPIGDDYRHGLWIEVPRGKPSDWASFKEVKEWGEGVNTREEYLEYWKSEFPMDSYWYFLSVSQYNGHTYLHITDNDHHWCIIHDDVKWDQHGIGPVDWYLEPLLLFLQERVTNIVQEPDDYNRYVGENLPKRQRTGRIARKDLNRIVPWQRQVPRNLERAIQVLKECAANEKLYRMIWEGQPVSELPSFYRPPLRDMNIRLYAKYFKVAYLAYEDYYAYLCRSEPKELGKRKNRQEEMLKMSDVKFYRRYQMGNHGEITDETDFDSVEEFNKMAYDHYGELGLSRMNVHATDYYTPGNWLITFGISYSAYVDIGVEIAVALYDSGCPLIVHDTQKLLDILEERDGVKLTPHTFHDYMNHHKEGTVFSLPYECYLGLDNEITKEQYDEIVSLAEWNPEEQVILDTLVPMESHAYDLIRDEVQSPLTVCGILAALQQKYDIVYGIMDKEDKYYCYLVEHCEPRISIQDGTRLFSSCNEALLDAIIRYVLEKQKRN